MPHKEHTHIHKYLHILPAKVQKTPIEMVNHDVSKSSINMRDASGPVWIEEKPLPIHNTLGGN
jgi:hypothetical protein